MEGYKRRVHGLPLFFVITFLLHYFFSFFNLHIKLETKRTWVKEKKNQLQIKKMAHPSRRIRSLNFFSLFEATYYIFSPLQRQKTKLLLIHKANVKKTKPTKKPKNSTRNTLYFLTKIEARFS